MSNTKNYHENSIIIIDEKMLENAKKLVNNDTTLENAVEIINDKIKYNAFLSVFDSEFNILWDKIMYGIYYSQIDDNDNDNIIMKKLSISECFILKANKKSYKKLIPIKILNRIKVFAVNLANYKRNNIGDDTLKTLKVNAKINGLESCFYCDTASSINKLEEQFQIIIDLMLGENVLKMKKTYVRHLAEQFTIAYIDGYKNGNEIKALQLIINHMFDCTVNKQYENKSSLDLHKEVKEKATK